MPVNEIGNPRPEKNGNLAPSGQDSGWLSTVVQEQTARGANFISDLKNNPQTQKQALEVAAGAAVVVAGGIATHKFVNYRAEQTLLKDLVSSLRLEDIKIVPLSKENLPGAIKAAREGFGYAHGLVNPKRDLMASLKLDGAASVAAGPRAELNSKYFVATDGKGNVLGTTGLYQTPRDASDSLWVGWMSVRPAFRGKGIGDSLMQFTIDEARKDGAQNLRLYTSTTKGELAAQSLYEKHGLKVVGSEKHDLPIPGLKYLYRELKLKPSEIGKAAETAEAGGAAEANALAQIERTLGARPAVVPEETLSMRELAAKDEAAFQKTLDAYMPKLQQAFPDASEIESRQTYSEYLKDPDFAWDMHVLRDKAGNVLGGIQSQVVDVGGEQLKKAVWAEHIWLAPEARSFQNFQTLLKTAQERWAATGSDMVFMEFNDRAKMSLAQQIDDAAAGLTPEAREKIWGRVGLHVLGDQSGRVAPYAQPAMGDGDPVKYLSMGFARLDGKSLAGQTMPANDYLKLMKAAHQTIPDVNPATDPTVLEYTAAVNKLIAKGETHLTFAKLKDTTVERLISERFIKPPAK